MGVIPFVPKMLSIPMIYVLVLIGCHQVFPQALAPDCTYKQVLDQSSGLTLEWRIDKDSRVISMTIEAEKVSGAIVLGLTRRGQLEGADVMVCGIREDGTPYIHDMHGVNNDTVEQDDNQDWDLISGERFSTGRTVIRIQRELDTCDEQDVPISSELIYVIWNIRDNHDTPSSIQPTGVKRIFFQDSFILPQSYKNAKVDQEEDVSQWRVQRRHRMPKRHTSNWCSMHKGPSLKTKHHIVGFKAYHQDEVHRHIHHQILYRCTAPQGVDPVTLFEPFVGQSGEECYLNADPKLPIPYCREIVYIDSVGSEPTRLPPQVGIPIGEFTNEYFLFEGHYDNPDHEEIEVESWVDLEYSSKQRENEGSIIFVGHGLFGTFIQPPRTSQYTVVGHCSKECTSKMLPPTGIEILGISPHAHMSTQRMRLRHYRDGNELPYIISDMNFDSSYQQLRLLEDPVTILPGDQLTLQCGYDNRWANGSATTSGFSTKQEMCIAFLLLNKRIPYLMCNSEYPEAELLNRFGIHNVTWNADLTERVVDSAENKDLTGLTLPQSIEQFTNWTAERVAELEGVQMLGNHRAACPNVRDIAGSAFRTLGQADSEGLVRDPGGGQDSSQDEGQLPPVAFPTDIPEYVEFGPCPQKSDMKISTTPAPVTSQRITLRRVGVQRDEPTLPAPPGDAPPRLPLFRVRVNKS